MMPTWKNGNNGTAKMVYIGLGQSVAITDLTPEEVSEIAKVRTAATQAIKSRYSNYFDFLSDVPKLLEQKEKAKEKVKK